MSMVYCRFRYMLSHAPNSKGNIRARIYYAMHNATNNLLVFRYINEIIAFYSWAKVGIVRCWNLNSLVLFIGKAILLKHGINILLLI